MVTEAGKEQLILAIRSLNRSASEQFLAQFTESDLREYLASLRGTSPTFRGRSASRCQRPVVSVA